MLIFNEGYNSTTILWVDPSIPVEGERNASFRLCDNNFHQVRVQKNEDRVTLTVDKHEPVVTRLPQANYQLRGNFYIGGVPGMSTEILTCHLVNTDYSYQCRTLQCSKLNVEIVFLEQVIGSFQWLWNKSNLYSFIFLFIYWVEYSYI